MSVICDLDGVVYRGGEIIPGSDRALELLRKNDTPVFFATNNSSRTPRDVAAKINRLSGYPAEARDVVTSAQAAARIIPNGVTSCLVLGGTGLKKAVTDTGRKLARSGEPVECVLVGIDSELDYEALAAAAGAVRSGAVFIASNTDPTFPTPDGLLPGAGAIVAAVATAAQATPLVAGKPEAPMRDLIKELVPGPAWVIGDRIDTDIEMANREMTWKSILVMSGVTGTSDGHGAADFVADDLADAVELVLSDADRQ
ncbi:MAG: HAD-IIA family hydrolase [Acidimicrobiia bacterium]|nr:HAD-IIA family hydrolase [Acidimicrobiia bacterium]